MLRNFVYTIAKTASQCLFCIHELLENEEHVLKSPKFNTFSTPEVNHTKFGIPIHLFQILRCKSYFMWKHEDKESSKKQFFS
jgi:hypothetical protein